MTSTPTALRQLSCLLLIAACLAIAAFPARLMADGEAQTSDGSTSQEAVQREARASPRGRCPARSAAVWAKADLDEVAATQFDAQKAAGQDRMPAMPGAAGEPAAKHIARTAIESLQQKIANLRAERADLLTHMTAEHPLIVDADVRLEEMLRDLAEMVRSATGSEALPAATPQVAAQPAAQPAPRDEAQAKFQRALARWDAAQKDLQAAIDAEVSAAERLTALKAHTGVTEAVPALPVPNELTSDVETTSPSATTTATAAPAAPASKPVEHAGSRPLVLGALIVALVVAAFASVKLARGTNETVFAGADDVASALSLPVVGIIPALSGIGSHGSMAQRFRGLALFGQLLVAVAVFAAVAYFVQNPSALWQFLSSPLETLGIGAR